MNIAIIPARSGSKRIKNKNIKFFFGKPIIEYAINTVIKSKIFNKIIINSDLNQKIFNKYNDIIFEKRPSHLANDKVTVTKVLEYQIKELKFKNKETLKKTNVCLIYPTACMLNELDLKNSYKIFQKSKALLLLSVNKIDKKAPRCFVKKNLYLEKFNKYNKNYKGDYYIDSGYFCWASAKTWSEGKNCYNSSTIPYILDSDKCHDINTIEDWKEAKKKFMKLKNV